MIEALVESGHAYEARGDVYFRVASYPDYGKLSNRPLEEMQQGEGDDAAEVKEAPQDFALWKAHKEGEDTFWESPWGEGRPGWHIECSAMAEEILGVDFEVHGGGSDLVFPHHENEIAQTEAARGKPLARVWMHNGMIEMGAEKMAKSVGNIRLLHGALEEFGREAFVMWLVSSHYRKPVAYTEEALADARRAADRLRELARRLDPDADAPGMDEYAERFFDALADDFNTPQARAVLFDWVAEANRRIDAGETLGPGRLGEMLYILGLESLLESGDEEAPDELRRLAEERDAARAARDFERALSFYGEDYWLQVLRGPRTPYARLMGARRRLDELVYAEIARRRASGARGEDVLSLLMDTELSDQHVRDEVMTLLFAGHDTTTSTVTFLFYELARNPEQQAPLLTEQDSVLYGGLPSAA
ncbi:MAG: cytochrome P450, partial [Thermoleophilia bacterium]